MIYVFPHKTPTTTSFVFVRQARLLLHTYLHNHSYQANRIKKSTMAKKNKQGKGKKSKSGQTKKESRISMQDLEELSAGSEGDLPPENEWDDDAKALKNAILSGQFDHLLEREDGGGGDDESIEEVELDERYDTDPVDEDDDESVEEEEKAEEEVNEEKVDDQEESEEESGESEEEEKNQPEDEASNSDEEDEEEENAEQSIDQKNHVHSKALHVVTEALVGEKKDWPWAETFQVVPSTPLPFGAKAEGSDALDIHDDLKREVAFYDLALEAALKGQVECQKAGIPFTRPEDFFVEMVKSDGKDMLPMRLRYRTCKKSTLTLLLCCSFRSYGADQGPSHL